jgi:hypothetical protein
MHDRCIRGDDEIDERDDGGGVVEILEGIAEMAQLRIGPGPTGWKTYGAQGVASPQR